jgi:hypothetical protein
LLLSLAMTAGLSVWAELLVFQSASDARAVARDREWRLREAVLYGRDLQAGEALRVEDLVAQEVSEMLDTAETLHEGDRLQAVGRTMAVSVREGDVVRRTDFGEPRQGQLPPVKGTLVSLPLGHGSQNLRVGDRLSLVLITPAREARALAAHVLVRDLGGTAPPGPVSGDPPVLLEVDPDAAPDVELSAAAGTIHALVEPG